jgi:hypothetical protein
MGVETDGKWVNKVAGMPLAGYVLNDTNVSRPRSSTWNTSWTIYLIFSDSLLTRPMMVRVAADWADWYHRHCGRAKLGRVALFGKGH